MKTQEDLAVHWSTAQDTCVDEVLTIAVGIDDGEERCNQVHHQAVVPAPAAAKRQTP